VCGILFWFHPAIQWAARRAELSREYLCDEFAASAGGTVASYLRTLATVAEQNANAPPCTLAFGRRKSAIVRRSERLVNINEQPSRNAEGGSRWATVRLVLFALLVSQLWMPVNVLASPRRSLSPWPRWTAETLHDFGVTVRDYEPFDFRHDLHDLLHSPR
jgi:beta-lactamase regulating signal transducer with metallopeptidase domain